MALNLAVVVPSKINSVPCSVVMTKVISSSYTNQKSTDPFTLFMVSAFPSLLISLAGIFVPVALTLTI